MEKNVRNSEVELNPAGIGLLRAAGVPSSLEGAGRILPTVQLCLDQARTTWSSAPFNDWILTMNEVKAAIERAVETDIVDPVLLFSVTESSNAAMHEVQRWRQAAMSAHECTLQALLGRALVTYQRSNLVVPVDFLSGLHTLRLAKLQKGHRSSDWERLVDADLCSTDQVQKILEETGPKARSHGFLAFLSVVLTSTVHPPRAEVAARSQWLSRPHDEAQGESTESGHRLLLDHLETVNKNSKKRPSIDLGPPETSAEKSTAPRISARLAAADYTSVSEKLGLHDREHLLQDDLISITKQLPPILLGEDLEKRGFATLAMTSLITCTSDHFTLNIGFQPVIDGIWLDLAAGAWSWDFCSYQRSGSTQGEDGEIAPVRVPIPSMLHELLTDALRLSPEASRLEELICRIQGVDQFDIKGFRAFLRGTGDSAHPPYLGRFARSYQSFLLSTTGSDMLTGLLTASFSMTAPAALFYFGPTYQTVYTQLDRVFHKLGFGTTKKLLPELNTTGCVDIPSEQDSQTGWERLVQECNELRRLCLGASAHQDRLDLGARWMEHLCAAFILQVAHRGTRLEMLTSRALLTDFHLGVIHDKDDTTKRERQHARLVPWTPVVQQIFAATIECHAVMRHAPPEQAVLFEADSPLFCKFTSGTNEPAESVSSQAVSHVIHHHFKGAPINVGRSIWVTRLDQCGCDRWLIRALTGHTRDVTRVGDALFDVAPRETARRLHEPMCTVSARWFGSAAVVSAPRPFSLKPAKNFLISDARVSSRPGVPDPRALLDPIGAEVLSGWKLAQTVRSALLRGEVSGSPGALGLLHLTFLDLLPDPDVGAQAIDPSDTSAWYSIDPCPALLWTRPHFKHPVWLPIRPSTWIFLKRASSQNRAALLAGVEASIKSSGLSDALPIGCEIWQALCACAKAYRRLELQPTLQTVSHPLVPAPCLNPQSIFRLTSPGKCSHDEMTLRVTIAGSNSKKPRGSDLAGMSAILNRLSNQDLRLGERRQRAVLAIESLNTLEMEWSQAGAWLREWITEELIRSRDNQNGCYQISSVATYFATLLVDIRWTNWDDPQEWDGTDWTAFCELINSGCRSPEEQYVEELAPRAKHALSALVRSLIRRSQPVPYKVLKRLAEPMDAIPPADSASAVLILQEDYNKAIELLNFWLSEEPGVLLIARTRAEICNSIPVRSGEVSSLPMDCLTRNGALVIHRTGFNNLKTETSIRTVAVADSLGNSLKAAIARMKVFVPAADLLIRGTGTGQDVDRDNRALELWKAALKAATTDPKARPHSHRAATLQELTWPGWQGIVRKLTEGTLTQAEASGWIQVLQSEWHRLARATAAAGQSGIQSAIGYYLSGWPLVHAVQSLALIPAEPLHPSLLRQLAISPDNYRKAKSRHTRSYGEEIGIQTPFCGWSWLCKQLGHSSARQKTRVIAAPPDKRSSVEAVEPNIPALEQLRYLCLVGLGMSSHEAHLRVDILWSQAARLDQLTSSSEDRAACNRRSRATPGARGQRADLELCLSEMGNEILAWLVGLRTELVEFLLVAFIRDLPAEERVFDKHEQWSDVMQTMPGMLGLVVRRGKAYITQEEIAQALRIGPRYELIPDTKLGRRPQVRLTFASKDNRVMSSRLTSVLRIAALSLLLLRNHKSVQP